RMGRDKALLEYHGETLLARHLRLADAAGMRVYLASGGTAYPHPPAVQTVADALAGRAGPLSALAGALAAIAAAGGTETLLLPVDTLVTPAMLRDALAGAPPAPFVCLVQDGQPQPLFARVSTTLLPRLHEWLESGLRRMMPLAALSGVRYVIMPTDWPQPINFNTLEDWQTLENSDALHPS
ncbi:molybdenum cofactor guanylyltransferase, partial [Cardiobacterium hominis]